MKVETRALALLASSFGLAWVATAMTAAPGPAAWVALSGNAGHAGLYFAVFSLSTAGGAILGGRAMDAFGRRPVLASAHAIAAAGFAVAGLSYAQGRLATFILGLVMLAGSTGTVYLTRLAAAEMFEPARRAGAVARVQVTATIGAIGGPLLLLAAGPLARAVGAPATTLVWFLAPPILILASALVLLSPEPSLLAQRHAAPPVTGVASRIPLRPLLAAVVALVCAQAAMVAVMGVTGVELAHAGHTTGTTSLVMAFHFAGMFGLSLVVGRMADRVGRRMTLIAGLAILAAGGLTVAIVPGAIGLAMGLLLVGLGWSFAYIGGTVLLADIVPAIRRARVIGTVDFSTALLAATASFTAGHWYAARGISGLGLAAMALMAVPLVFAFVLREHRPAEYGVPTPL